MTNRLQIALALAGKGFHVFPVAPRSKIPDIDGWQRHATTEPDQIRAWWTCPVTDMPLDRNIGICTTRFGTELALVVVDVDNKGDKDGDGTVLDLELEGFDLPPTLEGVTPTGGKHLIYYHDHAVNQRKAGFLGDGIDIRSHGGYILAAGSEVEAGEYGLKAGKIARAPKWLIEKLGKPAERSRQATASQHAPEGSYPGPDAQDESKWAHERSDALVQAAEATEGERNGVAYRLSCQIRDLGLSEATTRGYLESWNLQQCVPPMDETELDRTVESAFRTAQNPAGSAAPQADFQPAAPDETGEKLHPFDRLNREYALVLAGGGHHILWETTDEKGQFKLEHLSEQAFHKYHAAETMEVNGKYEPLTKRWINSDKRRSYQGLVFAPGKTAQKRFYNLWRGFNVRPIAHEDQISKIGRQAVENWHEHALQNICRGNPKHYEWLMNWFAHMIQYPAEKPLVAIVLRGGKGTGKSAPLDRIGALLGSHYMATANRRYLVGNFNAHLERMLFFVLEEAFWSGDKAVEGVLKDLVTGQHHVIEPKGREPYQVDNLARIAVIGNEDWLVPASADERRWAVFNVGEGRKQDREFFTVMREGIDNGDGGRLLLKQLMDWPVDRKAVNSAPSTSGLVAQKLASLDLPAEWWYACLCEGSLIGSEFEGWPDTIRCSRVYAAFSHYFRDRNVRARLPHQTAFGRSWTDFNAAARKKKHLADGQAWCYEFKTLAHARKEFELYIGEELDWPDDEDQELLS